MTFDPTSVEVLCVTLPKDHCVQVPWKYIKVCGYSDLFCKNLKQRSLTPRWPLTPHLLRSSVEVTCVTLPKDHCVQVPWKHIKKYVDTVTLFAKTWTKGQWPVDDLWPRICWGLMCDSTQGSLCPSPMKIHQSMWIQWPFLQKKLEGHWPLDDLWPHICWGHMCDSTQGSLCPSPMKIHQSIVDTVNLFAKTWTKGHWPLDDLWPHICWGHRCDSNQGSLCPSPMGIHQCMWIQWSILQKLPHTYTYIHTTYRISDHTVSFWTTFRRDKKRREK